MKHLLAIFSILAFVSCGSGGGKKVLVMASGKIQVSGNTVTLQPGTSHNETTLVPDGDSITVVAPAGTQGYSVKENGFYLLNLKKDTVTGTRQRIGREGEAPQEKITQENLKTRIDSLYQLMVAYNVNEKSGQYSIPPSAMARITDNVNAEIVGPFRGLPNSFDPSREHEVYKFYTNKEIWDLILRLHKMTQ